MGLERVVSICLNLSTGLLRTRLSKHSFLTLGPHTKAIVGRSVCVTTGRLYGWTLQGFYKDNPWETHSLCCPGRLTACLGCLRSVDIAYTQCWGPNTQPVCLTHHDLMKTSLYTA